MKQEDYKKAFMECDFEKKEEKHIRTEGKPVEVPYDAEDTLVERIRRIGLDDVGKVMSLLEAERKSHPVLEAVIQKKATFEEAYKTLTGKYSGWSFWLPQWVARWEKSLAESNRDIVNDYNLSSRVNALFSPFSLLSEKGFSYGLVTGFTWAIGCGMIASFSYMMGKLGMSPWLTNNLTNCFLYAGPVLFGASIIGLPFFYGTKRNHGLMGKAKRLKEDLKYLDEAVRKAYK